LRATVGPSRIGDQANGAVLPDKFIDHCQAALEELIGQKLVGNLPERPPEREPAQ
jgi:hypothetical protein